MNPPSCITQVQQVLNTDNATILLRQTTHQRLLIYLTYSLSQVHYVSTRLSCHREAARRFMSFKILLSLLVTPGHSRASNEMGMVINSKKADFRPLRRIVSQTVGDTSSRPRYYLLLIGHRIRAFDWYQFQWPWI